MDKDHIPNEGPEGVLARVTRRLGLRYSNTFVTRVVASHPRPNSLLALVEVAPALGLKVTAGQTEAGELDALDGPTIVHFGSGEGGGFGVLEGRTADGFKVWDGKRGTRVIGRDAFLEHWSGIVVLVERDDTNKVPEDDYVKNRLLETAFGGNEPPALVGSRFAPILRVLLGLVLGVLLVLAIAATEASDRAAAAAIAVLAVAGLGVTILTGVSIAAQNSPLSERICARGKYVNCQSVLASRYSRIFGWPLSDLGISLYSALLLLIASGSAGDMSAVWTVVGWVFLATVPVSLILIGAQIAMRQLCTLCLAVHAINMGAAAIFLIGERSGVAVGEAVPALALFVLFYALVLFLGLPMFRKHQGLAVLAGIHRRISASPFASLAEILTETPTAEPASSYAIPLGTSGARHELTVFVHPSCNKCDAVFGEIRALAQSDLVQVLVGVAPREAEESDRRACAAVVAAGMEAVSLDAAYVAAKKNLKDVMGENPVGTLAVALNVDPAAIEVHLDRARPLVEGAEAFVDRHAEGTPALFVDSRLYRGELSHLAYLLQLHPELLDTTRAAPEEATR